MGQAWSFSLQASRNGYAQLETYRINTTTSLLRGFLVFKSTGLLESEVRVLESLWQLLKLGNSNWLEVDCLRVSLTSVVTVKTLSWLPADRLRIQRSCGEIPELFTLISIMAAGTGSTALFTVICIFASRRVPFCTNKFFNTGLGFSLVILLWAVDRLGRLWLLSWQQEQE
ncbi:hypothetical protein Bca52824_050303 [Brassica carinata]|uniref:Uncharacterized protein n=1 Tax=Brassica carinata TaxID=52824 RepID=A0A8X7UTX1_BRACI|nr:hypothetical protein Bca52824_050303 [Brassica carinata]